MRVLPAPLRAPIGLAYLLARAADTISDSRAIPPDRRLAHLLAFRSQVQGPVDPAVLGAIANDLIASQASAGEADLIRSLAPLLAELGKTEDADRARIQAVVTTLTEGMEMDLSSFPPEGSGGLAALPDAAALDRYTYLVAGCVGNFWTETSADHLPALSDWDIPAMSATGVRFGKALQLTNVLRDAPADLRNGRCYLPLDEVTALGLAPEDLLDPAMSDRARPVLAHWVDVALDHYGEAQKYIIAIPGSERRLRLAALWPVLMGLQTLAILAKRRQWLAPGTPAKVSRGWIYRMMARSAVTASSDSLVWRSIERSRRTVLDSL